MEFFCIGELVEEKTPEMRWIPKTWSYYDRKLVYVSLKMFIIQFLDKCHILHKQSFVQKLFLSKGNDDLI